MKIIYVIGTTLNDADLLAKMLVDHYSILKKPEFYAEQKRVKAYEIPNIEIRTRSLKTIMNEDSIPLGAKPYLTPNALIQGNTFDIFRVQTLFQSLKIKGGNDK